MKILDEYEVEVAIPSICKPGDVTYVVISKETQRFVNENHTHEAKTRSSRELVENLQKSKESMSHKQTEVTTGLRKTWVEKKWITIHSNPKHGSDLAIFISKTVTTMLRHFDKNEREFDGSRHWDALKSVLLRKFEGRPKKRIEHCKNKDGNL